MRKRNKLTISLFSEAALVILISLVTLLLQLISFATTWNGAKIYLDNIFPYASLCFAIAIQATSYFFANSLRRKGGCLKILALLTAMCCSIYFSYIGIYNSINSPIIFLQENYIRIAKELKQTYQQELEKTIVSAQAAINDASTHIITQHTALIGEAENIEKCRIALEDLSIEYTSDMRAPKQTSYENYEDYAVAYQAYINSISQSKNIETKAVQSSILNSFGFSSIEALNLARQNNIASMNALTTALGITEEESTGEIISTMTVNLLTAVSNTANGQALSGNTLSQLNRLFQVAGLCGYTSENLAQLTTSLSLCAETSASALIKDYTALVASLPEGNVTTANAMELKAAMDSEIMTAILQLNSLLPATEQLSYTNEKYVITDLYLIPIHALQKEATRMTAVFSLLVAALIDTLSLLFAVSLRSKKPIWNRRTLLFNRMEEYEPLIYASLPAPESPLQAIKDFLGCFTPSPQTESDGYMLRTNMQSLQNYYSLAALLCQINLAKIVPAGFLDNEDETLLLKARFVFWANSIIYEEKSYE